MRSSCHHSIRWVLSKRVGFPDGTHHQDRCEASTTAEETSTLSLEPSQAVLQFPGAVLSSPAASFHLYTLIFEIAGKSALLKKCAVLKEQGQQTSPRDLVWAGLLQLCE